MLALIPIHTQTPHKLHTTQTKSKKLNTNTSIAAKNQIPLFSMPIPKAWSRKPARQDLLQNIRQNAYRAI